MKTAVARRDVLVLRLPLPRFERSAVFRLRLRGFRRRTVSSAFLDAVAASSALAGRGRLVVLVPPAGGVSLRPLVGGGALGKGLLQTVDVLETVLRAFGQTAENDAFEIGRHVGLMLRRLYHFVADVGDHHVHAHSCR